MVDHSRDALTDEQEHTAPPEARSIRMRLLGVAGVAATATVLAGADPATTSWTPSCIVHSLTGFECPGCGATRASHHLLNGDIHRAAELNLLLVLVSPWLAWLFARWVIKGPAPRLRMGWGRGVALGAVVLVFTVLRNLALEPFTRLAAGI